MALTAAEAAELAALEQEASAQSSGLTPEEQAELAALEAEQAGPETVVQEQHPDISFKDRFVAKNFANSDEAQAGYIQKQHPELQVKTIQGQVVVRRPGETWRVIDPSSFEWQDVTDIGSDVAAGTGAGLATAAGGLAGNLPGAVGAGAAASGGLEALRQKIGKWMGVPQDVDYNQVGMSTAFGGAAPVMFGSGASAAQIAKSALKRGVSEQTLAQGQRGLVAPAIEKTVSRGLPKLAEYVSGVPAEATRAYANNPSVIRNMTDAGERELTDAAHESLQSGIANTQQKVWGNVISAAEQSGKPVDIGPAKAEIDNAILKLQTSELSQTPLVQDQIENLKLSRDALLKEQVGPVSDIGPIIPYMADIPNKISAKKALELQAAMSDAAQMFKTKDGLKSGRFTPGTSPDEIAWMQANQKAKNLVNEGINSATEGVTGYNRAQYGKLANLKNDIAKYHSSKEKTYNTLRNLDTPSKAYLRDSLSQVKDMTGVDIQPTADILSASKFYTNPALTPVTGQGATSTSRTAGIGGAAAALGYKLGGYPGAVVGATAANAVASPRAIRTYTDALLLARKTGMPVREIMKKYGIGPGAADSAWNMMTSNQEK